MSVATGWRNRIIGSGEEEPGNLLANPRNWRIHPKAQQEALAGVLSEVGWVQRVIVNQRSGNLIDGHLRVSLALRDDEPVVPVEYVDLSEAEEALILATLDPLSALATTDASKLDELLREVTTGEAAVQAMLGELAKANGLYQETAQGDDAGAHVDRAEELREQWGTERGQLWELPSLSVPGKAHRLLCGDATSAEDVARLMGGVTADMIWSDPPYGVEYIGKTKAVLTIQNDDVDGLLALLTDAFSALPRVCIPSAPFYIAHPPGALYLVFGDVIRAVGWRFHQTLIWVKDSMVLGHSDYHFKHEPIYYGFLPGDGRPGRGNHDGSHWYGDHSQTSVLFYDRPKRSEEHPTMKPPNLVAYCIGNSSVSGGAVIDPFLGSGTTMVAAEQTGRLCYGMDIEPKYVAVALERMAGMGLEPRLVS